MEVNSHRDYGDAYRRYLLGKFLFRERPEVTGSHRRSPLSGPQDLESKTKKEEGSFDIYSYTWRSGSSLVDGDPPSGETCSPSRVSKGIRTVQGGCEENPYFTCFTHLLGVEEDRKISQWAVPLYFLHHRRIRVLGRVVYRVSSFKGCDTTTTSGPLFRDRDRRWTGRLPRSLLRCLIDLPPCKLKLLRFLVRTWPFRPVDAKFLCNRDRNFCLKIWRMRRITF